MHLIRWEGNRNSREFRRYQPVARRGSKETDKPLPGKARSSEPSRQGPKPYLRLRIQPTKAFASTSLTVARAPGDGIFMVPQW